MIKWIKNDITKNKRAYIGMLIVSFLIYCLMLFLMSLENETKNKYVLREQAEIECYDKGGTKFKYFYFIQGYGCWSSDNKRIHIETPVWEKGYENK